jgi:UDP-N-acetylglucosamine acyltransferase
MVDPVIGSKIDPNLKTSIDPTARIESGAVIGQGVQIGPYCTIGPHVSLGDGCRLLGHVNVTGHTTIGPRTIIRPFASLGSPPQSFSYRGGPTQLTVGADCDIRENVTMNTGTEDDHGLTEVGNNCFLMVGTHVGHDCHVGNNVVFANNTMLGGHVTVGDKVVFGGNVAVRQFVRIGEGAMIVGMSGVRADVIPFGMAQGPLAYLVGLNVVGMRRRGLSKAEIHGVRSAYRELFFGSGEFRARIERVAADYASNALVSQIFEFIRAGKRPLTMATKRSEADEDT